MVAAWIYHPSPENLVKIRQKIDYNGEQLVKILGEKKFKKTFVDLWKEDKLKTMPKGYPAEHPHSELLKLKSFMVIRSFTDSDVTGKKFQKDLLDAMKTGKPLNDFLTEGLA